MKKKKKRVLKLRQEVKVKVNIVTSDDIKIYYTEKFQDFTDRYTVYNKNIIGTRFYPPNAARYLNVV